MAAIREIAGKRVEFDDEGFMVNPDDWTPEIAKALAREEGIEELTDRHWKVIEFCRADFKARGEPPTLRRITKAGGIPTKELFKLFPKGPAKKVARIAGLGKPQGCV
ncbi:MAG: TusE/DsrC/DsvC family sulfur relay protein [Chloroflexi bacterium]|nr:MAG: TusE/DsrC/DsvC family sulfur relay protein [Chloroflexota bacterium]